MTYADRRTNSFSGGESEIFEVAFNVKGPKSISFPDSS